MKKLTYFTDGGCEPNPGKGTWAFVCVEPRYEHFGSQAETTSNQMEMTAIIRAIEHALQQHRDADSITIYSDSQYCVRGFNEWMSGWASRDWTRIDRDTGEVFPVKNAALWQQLYRYRVQYGMTMPIRLIWVKGHNGQEHNERCDELVRQEYKRVFGGAMQH